MSILAFSVLLKDNWAVKFGMVGNIPASAAPLAGHQAARLRSAALSAASHGSGLFLSSLSLQPSPGAERVCVCVCAGVM